MSDDKHNAPRNSGMNIDSALVRELAELLAETGLSAIEVEDGDRKIKVARQLTAAAAARASSADIGFFSNIVRLFNVKQKFVRRSINLKIIVQCTIWGVLVCFAIPALLSRGGGLASLEQNKGTRCERLILRKPMWSPLAAF